MVHEDRAPVSGVLHPVGPEEPGTYWVRRAAVIAGVLIVLALIIALAVNAAGDEQQATPQASPSKAAPKPTKSPAAPTPSPTPSATSASPTPSPTKSSKKPSPSPTKTETPACDPDDVRTTLTGKQKFKAKEDLTFNLSVINGGAKSCVVEVNSKTFELKIYSGSDRIWSTDDCTKLVKPIKKTVGAEKSVEWKIKWDGKRSEKDCKSRPEVPQPGTYIASAHLEGAKTVKLGMTLQS